MNLRAAPVVLKGGAALETVDDNGAELQRGDRNGVVCPLHFCCLFSAALNGETIGTHSGYSPG